MHKLEKLNSSIDIIPLQSSSMDNSNNAAARRMLVKPDKIRGDEVSGRALRDPMIISRVRTYLYENEDKVYIDVTEMADCLQRKYRDYRGKKRGPFRAAVRKAYDEITENLTRQGDSHWQDDEDEIDIGFDPEADTMSNDYMQMSKRQAVGKQNGNSSDKELIDISSDDDQMKSCPPILNKPVKESMEIEQVIKRPHLCPTIHPPKPITQQTQEITLDTQSRSTRTEKSRKRPRDKENENIDLQAGKKKSKDISVINSTVKFSDVGGNIKVLETIANLLLHMKHPEIYIKLGISPPRGFLLHGPPGCGKTLLAYAIAGELKIPLLKVAAPELVAGVSGESEQRIRELFDQAIAIAPCILFLDEIDAVAPHRATAQKEMERRIVAQLLSCLDELGLKEHGSKVLVLGATNRPDSLDPALRRAGRFDREISLGIPDKDARAAILEVHTAKVPLSPEANLQTIASLTPGFVGADLVALIREAAMAAVNRTFENLQKNESVAVEIIQTDTTPNENKSKDTVEENMIEIPEKEDIDIIEEVPSEKVESKVATENHTEVDNSVVMSEEQQTPIEASKTSDTPEDVSETVLERPEVPPTPAPAPAPDSAITSTPEPTVTLTPEPAVTSDPIPNVIPAPVAEVTEKPEAAVEVLETIDIPIVSSVNTVSESNNVIELDKTIQEPQSEIPVPMEENGKKLIDILTWLHNEPPLTSEQLAQLQVTEQDFNVALKNVQPSAKREGFATVPDVTWDDIGSLQEIRQELQMTILAPIRHSEHFASLGLTTPTGVLLCGPPGCGKTLLAKAIANEAGINFISVKGPELLNMYVGESEKAVRQCFMRARNSAPCIIFFDELDALCPKRSDGDSAATSRVVNQMLTEMDGVECRKNVFLMAASNRPDIIDPAVLRPGRLDKILYVGLPSPSDRVDILRALTKNGTRPKLAMDVNLEAVANSDRCDGYTGADLASLVREAGVQALQEIMSGLPAPAEISGRHLHAAFDKVRPSVRDQDIKHYEKLQKLYSVKSHNNDVPMVLEPPIDSTMEAMET